MNNILIFSPTPSHPQNAGNRIRIYNLAKYLQQQDNKIHFIYFTQEGLTQKQEQEMFAQWDSLAIITKEKHYKPSTSTHYLIDDWYQENIGPIIQKKCKELNIDIALVNYIFQSKLLEFVPNNIVKIIDTIDRFSDRHLMQKKQGLKPDYFYTTQEEEAKALNRADIILAIQKNEAEFFHTLTEKKIETIGHIEKSQYLNKQYSRLNKIGFIGSANSANLKSLSQFIDKFTQYIDTHNFDIKLLIAGAICSKIESTHNAIKLLGFVDNLKDFYETVDLVINPLILGTGLKIKSIEALSYGVPIISTHIGFDGIASKNLQYHFSKDADALIKSIDTLYTHPHLLQDLAQQSQTIFTKNTEDLHSTIKHSFRNQNEMSRLLFITHINFWEKDLGSRMRLYYMLNYLKAYFSITIVYTEKRQQSDNKKLREIGYEEQVVFLNELNESQVDEAKINAFLSTHMVLKDFYNPSLYKKMQTYINEKHFDNIIIEYIHFSYFLPLLEGTECFLDSIDMMNIRNDLFKKNSQKHWIDISEAQEFALFNMYKAVLAIQQKEHNYLVKNGIKSLLVPYSYPIKKANFTDQMKCLVFVGGDTQANIEAIHWFLAKVWPLFTRSGLRLEIYGSVSQTIQGEKEVLQAQNIFVKGRIDNLNNLYSDRADFVINPVHIGGGLKIKNVEALANGLPLITTGEGANGLEDGINDAFLLADSAEEWTDAIIALMLSDTLRKKLSENAYTYAKNHFSEKVCYEKLTNVLQNFKNDNSFDDNTPIEHTNISQQKASAPLKEIINTMHKRINETKKRLQHDHESALEFELAAYKNTLDILEKTSILKLIQTKFLNYKILLEHYTKFKPYTYNAPLDKERQKLLLEYRKKIQTICDINIKRNPIKKAYTYKKLLNWHANLN